MQLTEQEFTRLVKQHKETIYSVCLMAMMYFGKITSVPFVVTTIAMC